MIIFNAGQVQLPSKGSKLVRLIAGGQIKAPFQGFPFESIRNEETSTGAKFSLCVLMLALQTLIGLQSNSSSHPTLIKHRCIIFQFLCTVALMYIQVALFCPALFGLYFCFMMGFLSLLTRNQPLVTGVPSVSLLGLRIAGNCSVTVLIVFCYKRYCQGTDFMISQIWGSRLEN